MDWWPHQSRASTPASWLVGLAPATLATLRWWLRENEMKWKMKSLKYEGVLTPDVGLWLNLLNMDWVLENVGIHQNPQITCSCRFQKRERRTTFNSWHLKVNLGVMTQMGWQITDFNKATGKLENVCKGFKTTLQNATFGLIKQKYYTHQARLYWHAQRFWRLLLKKSHLSYVLFEFFWGTVLCPEFWGTVWLWHKEDVGSAMDRWLHKCPYNAINRTQFATFVLSAEQKTERQKNRTVEFNNNKWGDGGAVGSAVC